MLVLQDLVIIGLLIIVAAVVAAAVVTRRVELYAVGITLIFFSLFKTPYAGLFFIAGLGVILVDALSTNWRS